MCALISIPNTFTVGAVIIASQHNSNFSIIYTDYNGNIDNTNISASAAIADTKLAQITTASKVSGAALTSLGSIPSGGGTIPAKNGGTGGDMSTAAQGTVPYFSATGVQSALAVGTSGYYLQTQGASANPQWAFTGLGAWVSKTIDTIYQAATDGFVVFWCDDVGNGDSFSILTDSSTPPTTSRGKLGTSSGTTAFVGQLMTPVRKNDYYKVSTVSGTASSYGMYFIPLGS